MRTLGVIPARGGSKGLPGKNLMRLGGKTLVQWAIDSAKAATTLDHIVLTSDAPAIFIPYSAQVDIRIRPHEYATDEAGMVPVLQDAVRAMENDRGEPFDLVVCLQPTSPFRTGEDIDATVSLVTSTGAESAQTVTKAPYHPRGLSLVSMMHSICIYLDSEAFEDKRRQDGDEYYIPTGSVYVTTRRVLMQRHRIIGDDHHAHITPFERSVNINTLWDFRIAEMIYAHRHLG